jgi:hypothetical protein
VFDEYRWWSADELASCPNLYPEPYTLDLLTSVLHGDIPTQPREWRV